MRTKQKPKKKRMKSKRTAAKRTPTKNAAHKKLVKKKVARKSAAAQAKTVGKKKGVEMVSAPQAPAHKRGPTTNRVFSRKALETHSGEQSGDQQGISRIEGADSESVDELLEEGNAFEADVVAGVEDAEGADETEVRTHEVPEDDLPSEYLDKD